MVVTADRVTRIFRSPAETVRAVDGVSLTVHEGEFLCIHGASGSGKSTLLNLIAGLDEAESGTVVIDGQEVSGQSAGARASLRLSTVGVVFQHDNLIEEFTAAENVAFPLELRGRSTRAEIDDQAQEWLGRVGMGGFARRFPAELSGGQQQRVGIARALIGHRRVLVADEPTGSLDSANSRALYGLIRELSDQGTTAVMTSHDPVAREYCTRAIGMTDGQCDA